MNGNGNGSPTPTVFLIEEDDETRPLLKSNLQSYGYRVVVALDEADALERAGGGHVAADLVLVNLVGKSIEEALALGRRVRESARYDGRTPLVVLPESFGEEMEGRDVCVSGNDWVTYPEDALQLRDLLARLLPRADE